MATQRYLVSPHPIETLLTWIKSGDIAIPEIQRPFVWDAAKVRDFLDSLYRGYPVGYLIVWRNPTVRLKDGSKSSGKRILIDGQQRVTALMASLLGKKVLTKDYETIRIRIAFHPVEQKFEVLNPAIQKDPAWIPDLSAVFSAEEKIPDLAEDYAAKNPSIDRFEVSRILLNVRQIIKNEVSIIELAEDLDVEEVTEIFIRVNSAGVELNQADFAMSKIAASEKYGGNLLRKAIDYFCHLAVAPEFLSTIEKNDKAFATSEFLPKMRWLKDVNDDLYDPSYTDMLRVAFTSEFRRGKLQDLVALLSGRNFETRRYEEEIAESSFAKLKAGIFNFMNKTHFECLMMILRSAGFVSSRLIGSQNAVNFAYIMFLHGRTERMSATDLERLVRRWYVMSVLTGRYSGSPESSFDFDIRQIDANGLSNYAVPVIDTEISENFWNALLPQQMNVSSSRNPAFVVYQAASVKLQDRGFLSRDITAHDMVVDHGDVHHIYPRKYLKDQGLTYGRYNQIANLVRTQTEINIAIGGVSPKIYFAELSEQCNEGKVKYGGITDPEKMRENFRMNCIPEGMLDGTVPEFDDFLEQRRKLMAQKIRTYFKQL